MLRKELNMRNRKGHLNAWESHQSPRAQAKKDRAKKTKTKDKILSSEEEPEFMISRENFVGSYGIVAQNHQGRMEVLLNGEFIEAHLSPNVDSAWVTEIAVGDHVVLENVFQQWQVVNVLERTANLTRLRKDSTRWGLGAAEEHLIAANVDIAIIVVAAKNPPFHPKLIDRYLVLIQHGGITPVICLNKIDLLDQDDQGQILDYYSKMGIAVVQTSTETSQGIEQLKAILRGKRSVMVGHSGVGKSSLINALLSSSQLKVGKVSEKGGKGRHTTTSSELLLWEKDSVIIDTPGIRSLGIHDIEPQDLQLYFDEIWEASQECKFSDCLHANVDASTCAVVRAVNEGKIPRQRYESYLKLLEELS